MTPNAISYEGVRKNGIVTMKIALGKLHGNKIVGISTWVEVMW